MLREAIDSEENGSSILNYWIISEDTNISSWSQSRKLLDEFDVISFNSYDVCCELERERDSSQCFLFSLDILLFVFEDAFVCSCKLSFFSNFSKNVCALSGEKTVCSFS